MKSSPGPLRPRRDDGGGALELHGAPFALAMIAVLILLTCAAPVVLVVLTVYRAAAGVRRRAVWPPKLVAACGWATCATVAHVRAAACAGAAQVVRRSLHSRHP